MVEKIFKTKVFGGFDQADVLEYIDQMRASFQDQQQKITNAENTLQQQLKEANDTISRLTSENEKLDQYNKQQANKIAELLQNVQLQKQEQEQFKSQAVQSHERFSEYEKLLSDMAEQLKLEEEKNRQLKEKIKDVEIIREKYQDFNNKIEDILNNARAKADSTLTRANENADKIIEQAQCKLLRAEDAMRLCQKKIAELKQYAVDTVTIIDKQCSDLSADNESNEEEIAIKNLGMEISDFIKNE